MDHKLRLGEIRKVPIEETGVADGVEMMVNSSIMTIVHKGKQPGELRNIGVIPCKILTSYENGVISFSVRSEKPFILSVRLDETMALIQAASDRHRETTGTHRKKSNRDYGGNQQYEAQTDTPYT